MIRFTFRSRRRFLTAIFLLLCPALTGFSLLWASTRAILDTTPIWQATLTRTLGLDVSLRSARVPRPHVIELSQVEFREPETGALIAASEQMDVVVTDDKLLLTADEMDFHVTGITTHYEPIHDRIFKTNVVGNREVSLYVATCHLHRGDEVETIRLNAKLRETGLGPELNAKVTEESGAHLELRVNRNRQTTPAITRMTVSTEGTTLPCRLLGNSLAEITGPNANFSGVADFIWNRPDWTLRLNGDLNKVDMGSLIQSVSLHAMTGEGNFHFDDLRIDNGKLKSMKGEMIAGPGVIGIPLVKSSSRYLRFRVPLPLISQNKSAKFDKLGFSFELRDDALKVRGSLMSPESGIVAVNPNQTPIIKDSPVTLTTNEIRYTFVGKKPADSLKPQIERLAWIAPRDMQSLPASIAPKNSAQLGKPRIDGTRPNVEVAERPAVDGTSSRRRRH